MARRGRRLAPRQLHGLNDEEVVLEEKQLPTVFNLAAPSSGEPTRPLRLLDQFQVFTQGSAEDVWRPRPLQELSKGAVNGLSLQALGVVLEHKRAETSLLEAREAAYVQVRIRNVRDWVVDHSEPRSIWLVTDVAWYRLLKPAAAYEALFAPLAERLRLLGCCAEALEEDRRLPFEASTNLVEELWRGRQEATPSALGHRQQGWEGGLGDSSVRGGALIRRDMTASMVLEHSDFLAPQLAVLLGRHAGGSPFVCQLAQAAGYQLSDALYKGRPLIDIEREGSSADPSKRPPFQRGFLVDAALQPGVLMVWDFCQTYRELLRLPPFPLERLERAFLDESVGRPAEAGKVGFAGQGCLLKDLHLSLLRVLEGLDGTLQEAPTMAGYGSAAELGPRDVYRPLLGVTWPELVRGALLDICASEPSAIVAAAAQELRVKEYGELPGAARLALLETLVALAADTELVRNYMHDRSLEAADDKVARGTPLGCDDSGGRYFQLASAAGADRIFVHSREEGSEDESQPGIWGWYCIEQIPELLQWLEGGSRSEQALAEDLFETLQSHLQAVKLLGEGASEGKAAAVRIDLPADGYAAARPEADFAATVREEALTLFAGVRFWEHDADWLRARTAVITELEKAATGKVFARLLWLMEDLMYTDLLKGTGWGRKRLRYRELLETAKTVSQAAVALCQVAVHCRRPADLGIMTLEEFRESLKTARTQPIFLPTKGNTAVVLRSGYQAHIQQARPPADALSAPLPRNWGFAEHVVVREICFARGDWQRPSWQGRFADGSAPPHPGAHDLLVACLLIERPPSGELPGGGQGGPIGEIDWEGFSFQTGFRMSRLSASFNPNSRPSSARSSVPPIATNSSPPLAPAAATASPEADHHSNALPTDGGAEHVAQKANATADLEERGKAAASAVPRSADVQREEEAHNNAPRREGNEPSMSSGAEARPAEAALDSSEREPEAQKSGRPQADKMQPSSQQPNGVEPENVLKGEASSHPSHHRAVLAGKEAAAPAATAVKAAASQPQPQLQLSRPTMVANPLLLELSRAAGFRQAAAPAAAGRSTTEPAGGLRRSSRVRTEVSMPDYEAGDNLYEAGPAPPAEGNKISWPLWFLPQMNRVPANNAGPEADTGGDDTAVVRFWRSEKDLAAVTFYVRKVGPASIEYLLLPAVYAAGAARAWTRGTPVKMPAYGSLARASNVPDMRWYTGLLNVSFSIPEQEAGGQHVGAAGAPSPPAPAAEAVVGARTSTVADTSTQMQVPSAGGLPTAAAAAAAESNPPDRIASSQPPPVSAAARLAVEGQRGPAGPAAGDRPPCSVRPVSGAPVSAAAVPPQPAPFAGPMPGMRLSDLMPQHAILGNGVGGRLGGNFLQSGGPGGPADPWKALSVSWDPGTMMAWPNRVSPWEVLEDKNGIMRFANEKAYQAVLSQQRADAAALPGRPNPVPGVGFAQLPGYAAHRPFLPQAGNYQRPQQVSAAVSQQAMSQPGASLAAPTAPFLSFPFPLHQQMPASGGQWLSPQIPGAAAAAFGGLPMVWQQAGISMPHLLAAQAAAAQQAAAANRGYQGGAEGRATARKRRSLDIEEKPAALKSTNEGYRERWLAKRPRPNPNTWLSGFCSACERAGGDSGLLSCMGPCLRAFHAACLGLSQQPVSLESWFCPECDCGRMRCFLCGEFSSGLLDPNFRKCSLGVCGRFFHLACARKAPLAQFARKGGHFRCPQHYCMSCGKSGDGMDMVKCIRCPSAYHSICMSSTPARRLHPHSKVVLCEKHQDGEPPPDYVHPPRNVPTADGDEAVRGGEDPRPEATAGLQPAGSAPDNGPGEVS